MGSNRLTNLDKLSADLDTVFEGRGLAFSEKVRRCGTGTRFGRRVISAICRTQYLIFPHSHVESHLHAGLRDPW